MRSRIFQKIGVVLGMIAILMATLAPTVSQALVLYRSHAPGMPAHCTMGHAQRPETGPALDTSAMQAGEAAEMEDASDTSAMPDMSMMPGMTMHADMRGGHDALGHAMHHADTHHTMSEGDACGYCSLLFHLPLMPVVSAPFATTVWAIQHRLITQFERIRRAEPLTFAQPRAPPVRS
ncbi:MAG TPA: DUF2946 domain-containing protein [Pararobbsia sp.]|nr:DUF2946 domain-containing protein [Pararobbsia sp.]